MAVDKLVDSTQLDSDLTSVANAIRTKGETSGTLAFPAGFVSAIQNISTGTDVSDTTAAAGNVLSGYYFYNASGVKTQGNIANGSITNNTSGGTSSGTINRGKQIKIGAGYYASDSYYTAQANSGTLTISSSGSTNCDGYANVSVGAGTITNNTSGGTSSGTINRGKQIKIGAGYYGSDSYFTAQSNSGTKTISASGTTSVDGYANASVAAGSAKTPATTITVAPSISVNSSGLITATNSKTQSVTPTVSAGYVSSGTAGTITVNGSNTSQMTTKDATTFNASTSEQSIASGTYLTGKQTIRAITTSNISAGNIKSGVTITVGDSGSSTRIANVTGTLAPAPKVSDCPTLKVGAVFGNNSSELWSKTTATYNTSGWQQCDFTNSQGQWWIAVGNKVTAQFIAPNNTTAYSGTITLNPGKYYAAYLSSYFRLYSGTSTSGTLLLSCTNKATSARLIFKDA